MDFIFKYGTKEKNIDITNIVYEKCKNNNTNNIYIPGNDHERNKLFTDPMHKTPKIIIINYNDTITYFNINEEIHINLLNRKITKSNNEEKLRNIHKQLKLDFGSLNDEYPEQFMTVKYLTGDEKVLEIGGNIGRNSLIIASILKDSRNLVSLESDPDIAKQLIHNRDKNNLNFHIENSALSLRNLIQKGWDTIVSNTVLEGYKKINTLTLEELNNKYNIAFDTLILDCEGAFYYILIDMPEILNGINLIIMENDYHDILKKQYIDDILKSNNFYVDYTRSGGWGCCEKNFYEVWKKEENIEIKIEEKIEIKIEEKKEIKLEEKKEIKLEEKKEIKQEEKKEVYKNRNKNRNKK